MTGLKQIIKDIQHTIRCIDKWPNPPDPTLVAAWAPLINEKLAKTKEALAVCERRLQPLIKPGMSMSEVEKIHITQTLEEVDNNREQAAELLGIGTRTLYRKIDEYGLR